MKKIMTILCGLVLLFAVSNAQAISLSYYDAYYVGHIEDGIPSSPADETGYLGNLITLAPGAAATTMGTETYDRVGSTISSLPGVPSFFGKFETGDFDTFVLTSGVAYILGKYDASNPGAGSYVWLLSSPGTYDLPALGALDKYGLSHSTVWYAAVPEPLTILLLGLGLVGLAGVGRKFKK